MLRMKKVLKGIIRGLDHIVNFYSIITDSCSYVSLRLYAVGFPSGISDCRCKNYEAYIPTEKSTKSFEELQKIIRM